MGQSMPLFVYFLSFQTNNTIFTANQCEKCPSSIQRRDSNPQPFEHETSPITTRPGLPPNLHIVCLMTHYKILHLKCHPETISLYLGPIPTYFVSTTCVYFDEDFYLKCFFNRFFCCQLGQTFRSCRL